MFAESELPRVILCIDEIKDEEYVEGGSIISCRICYQCDGDEDEDLISPCMCKGSHQFVHRSCLDQWRSIKAGFDFSHCTTCKAQFHLQVNKFEEQPWRKRKFKLFVARDVFFVFMPILTVIGLLGCLAYHVDKDGSLRNLFDDWDCILLRHPIPFYYSIGVIAFLVLFGFFGIIIHCCRMSKEERSGCCHICMCVPSLIPCCMDPRLALILGFVGLFMIIGIAYGFFVANIIMQRIWQRHYHILDKKELTQEYVVEDLNGRYTPAKLDPEHMERLKKLKLFDETKWLLIE